VSGVAEVLARSGIAKNNSRPVISYKLLARLRFQSYKAPDTRAPTYEYTPITHHASIMWGTILITTYRVKSTHFVIYALLFRETEASFAPFFFFFSFLLFVLYPIFLHSSLFSLLNACFMSSFIFQRAQFQMQCFQPYKYMTTRRFHGKTWDCDTYSRSYSQFPITYEYIHIRAYTSMSTNGNCSVIRKRKLDKDSKVKHIIKDAKVQFDINSDIHLDCSTGELK
jgi:hypothetical protein